MYCPKEQPMDACSSSSKIIAVGGWIQLGLISEAIYLHNAQRTVSQNFLA